MKRFMSGRAGRKDKQATVMAVQSEPLSSPLSYRDEGSSGRICTRVSLVKTEAFGNPWKDEASKIGSDGGIRTRDDRFERAAA